MTPEGREANIVGNFRPPNVLTIQGDDSKPLLVVDLDKGTVEADSIENANEAGRVFVQSVRRMLGHWRTDADTIEAQRAEIERLRVDEWLLNVLRDECWDLRSFSIPTGGGDADVGWRVIGHWQAEPHERTIAEAYDSDPRVAIRAALESPQP